MGQRVCDLAQEFAVDVQGRVAGLVITWIEGLPGGSAEPLGVGL